MTQLFPCRSAALTLLLGIGLGVAACKTSPDTGPLVTPVDNAASKETKTLAAVLAQLAPDYRVKAPAGSKMHLGHRLVGTQPETNACFTGEVDEAPNGGWNRIELTYDTSTEGALRLDFGSLLQIPLTAGTSVGGSKEVGVVLETLREHSLKNVYFLADGNCADDFESVESKTYPVITKAIKAGSIEISGADELVASAKVEVAKIGGAEVAHTTGGERRWDGAELFFADYPECLRVKVQKVKCENRAVGPGNTCDLGTCSFQVETKNGAAWTGSLSCQGGETTAFSDTLGRYSKAKNVADGVSYNMKVVQGTGTGSVTIELRRWSVGTASEGCGA